MPNRSTSGLLIATAAGAPMRSTRPKPIHLLCGRAMGSFVLETLGGAGVRQAVVVTGVDGGRVAKRLLEEPPGFPVRFAEQRRDLGIGDAALLGAQSFDDFNDDEDLLVVPADLPLLRPSTLNLLLDEHRATGAACTILTADRTDPSLRPAPSWSLADRVVRDRHGRVASIEADDDRLLVDDDDPDEVEEVSLGVFCIRRGLLAPALRRSSAESLDGRVRLTDVVAVLTGSGHACETVLIDHPSDLIPVNDRVQLAEAEVELRRRTNRHWLSMGVTMVDPERTYIDVTVRLGTDVTIFPGTILQGATTIGSGCELGPDTRLDRCTVGDGTRIEKTTASLAVIGNDCTVGPFAVLAPGTELADGTRTGPFYSGGQSTN
jgi:bifunctional UDP-N-acetylglucosamine pyrophosphorylase/glucosamine-1-phosphate N-acetyltransferase